MPDKIARRLREVAVRPTVGVGERRRWDELMAAHHYLPFRTLVGRSLRHVAVLGGRWLALVAWHAGAFKLRARRVDRVAAKSSVAGWRRFAFAARRPWKLRPAGNEGWVGVARWGCPVPLCVRQGDGSRDMAQRQHRFKRVRTR